MGREIAYRVFTSSPNVILDLQVETVIGTLQRGLEDGESIDVRHPCIYMGNRGLHSFLGPTSRLRGVSRISFPL